MSNEQSNAEREALYVLLVALEVALAEDETIEYAATLKPRAVPDA